MFLCLMVALLQFATVLCDACGTPFRVRMCRLDFEISSSKCSKR